MANKLEECLNVGIHKCPSVKRIIMCLHFYNTITEMMMMDDEDDNLLIEYFKQYPHLLNDYAHILSVHLNPKDPQSQQNYLDISNQINKYLKCNDISQCKPYEQNRKLRASMGSDKEEKRNHKMLYNVHILDSLHTFFIHSIDIGHKVNVDDIKSNKNTDYIDYVLQKRSHINDLKYPSITHTNDAYIAPAENTFNLGYRYHAWPWYKDNNHADEYNLGYLYKDWFIPQKYADLKQELLTNTICTISLDKYHNVLYKATEYLNNSDMIKAMRCCNDNLLNMHYDDVNGVSSDSVVPLQHIMAILFFADHNPLAMHLCTSLIKQNDTETDEILKQKVSEYRNWYRAIRECVELFGQRLSDKNDKYNMIYYASVSNVNKVMFHRYAAYFHNPFIVTRDVCSAIVTANGDKNGLILTLRQNGFGDGLMYFDCSYLSYFGYDNSLLLCGGYRPLMLYNVRSVGEKINYEMFIKPITFLDHFLNEMALFHTEPKPMDAKILKMMIEERNKCPQYVNMLFECFVNKQRNIKINMRMLKEYYGKLLNKLLFTEACEEAIAIYFVLKLFPNCECVEIETDLEASMNGNKVRTLSTLYIETLVNEIRKINEDNLVNIPPQIKIYQIEIDNDDLLSLSKQLGELDKKWNTQVVVGKNKEYLGTSLMIERVSME